MSNTKTVKVEKEFVILTLAKKLFKLDDDGRINSFISQEIKAMKTACKKLENNLTTKSLERDIQVDDFQGQLEDAKIRVEEAYGNINPELVVSNEDRKRFASTYWAGVKNAEYDLEKLEEEVENATSAYDAFIEDNKEQIAKYKTRITKLSKKA